jgi:hypothetical protein
VGNVTHNDEFEGVVEFRDPDIDSEAIMQRIRQKIRERRADAESRGIDYEAFVEGLYAAQVSARFDHDLYYDLRRMSVGYNKIGVGLSLTESRIPILGPIIQRIRRALHQLVIYYVNQLAGQQARFNEYTMRALTSMTGTLEDGGDAADMDALRKEVIELRERVHALETESGSN